MPNDQVYGFNAEAKVSEPMPGVMRRSLVWGDNMHLVEFHVPKGSGVPVHNHMHDQVGYVVSGRLEFSIGDAMRELGPGDAYLVPSNVVHSSRALEDVVVIDVFSPVREDYK